MKTAVIGAGITGLTCAHTLHKQGNEVLVLESQNRVGGVIHTERTDGFLVEHGPNSLLLDEMDLSNYFEELGLNDQIAQANQHSRKRFIVREGNLLALPLSPLSLLTTRAFSFTAKLRLLREFSIPSLKNPESLSVASFFKQRLGEEIFTYAGDPFVSGVYAGDPEKLSARHAFPRMLELEQEHGSILKGLIKKARARKKDPDAPKRRLINFQNGMGCLPKALMEKIRKENIRTGISLGSITRENNTWKIVWDDTNGESCEDTFERLVITVPAHAIPGLPFPADPSDALQPLAKIPHPPIACAALGFRRTQIKHPLDGFGVLVPSSEGKNLLGVIFASTLFPGRAPDDHVLIHCFLGGARNPAIGQLEASDLLEILLPELSRMLGVHGSPVFVDVKKWTQSIPQYNLGHERFLEILEEVENKHTGLTFAGSYRSGVSVGQCIRAGWAAAQIQEQC